MCKYDILSSETLLKLNDKFPPKQLLEEVSGKVIGEKSRD